MTSTATRPLRVAIVGSGPAGLYAADALLKNAPPEHAPFLDLFDRLPTPYGLVRYGVAPDHQKIKAVTRLYERTFESPQVRFFGNVTFGEDVTRDELRTHYDAVIYAVGSPTDRSLDIPGEALKGSLSATEFVAWYNGHPDYEALNPNLNVESVAVVGMGNVAVDVARILIKKPFALANTDISDNALNALRESRVQDVYMLGRRGPTQIKITSKELRELGELEGVDLVVDPEELTLDPGSAAEIADDPAALKNLDILRDFAARKVQGHPKRLHLRFFVSPTKILGAERVEGVVLERNRLEPTPSGYLNAVGTNLFETLPVGMVLRSVGYRGVALPGVSFDERRGVIPNQDGRVLTKEGKTVPGEYVAGWAKRGPTGVIGTNKADAAETVERLLEDVPHLLRLEDEAAHPLAVNRLLQNKGVKYVTFADWQALDRFETEMGRKQGRPRVKVTSLERMLGHCQPELVE